MNYFYILHETINKPLSIYLNSLTDDKIIWNIVYLFADTPIFILPVFLVLCWLYYNYKKNNEWKNKLLFIFYSTVIAIILSLIIQNFVSIERPETSLMSSWKLILKHIPDASFPSDHASVWTAFLVSLFLFWFIRIRIIISPFIIIMLVSRVAWWVHWPFDILAWVIVWVSSSFLVYKCQNLNIFLKINSIVLKFASYFRL
jgi:undecaprenyl-diphosphatase